LCDEYEYRILSVSVSQEKTAHPAEVIEAGWCALQWPQKSSQLHFSVRFWLVTACPFSCCSVACLTTETTQQ